MRVEMMQVELIEWLDSCGVDGNWTDVEEICMPVPVLCKSVGFVLWETDDAIRVASHYAPETPCSVEQVTGCMIIPQCAIVRRVVLVEEA